MIALTLRQCQGIVAEALLNKYPDLNRSNLDRITSVIWVDAISILCETDLQTLLKPINHFNDDINNQVVVLQLIDRFWACDPGGKKNLIQRIHNALFGAINHDLFRKCEFVADYGGVVATPVFEIKARIDELERQCFTFIDSFDSASPDLKAYFLAYIFCSIIRIHPFTDGNGRTARMFVFYALRRWQLAPIAIPKVRNDAEWKLALTNALAGNLADLQAQFLQRMFRSDSNSKFTNISQE